MSLTPIRRIYEITVDGRPVVFYSRFIGEVGRDIAAVKYALGNVYEADLENRSEDDGTLIGSQWFTCDGDNTPLNSITLATFDKRLQKSLMSFQLQNQFLIMNYYWDRGGIVNAIKTETDLPTALEAMMYRFDADYGTISEATIAILHGWRPSSDATNLSFVTTTEFPIEQIPEFMHEMYVDGTIQVDGTMIREVYNYNESKDNTDNVATDFDAQAASYRKWKDRIVADAEESGAALVDVQKLRDMERYVKYRASAITGQGTESKLYTATKEVLGILEDMAPEDVSPERREALIAAAVEPDHLSQVVPFLITNFKIGFFDRTDYSFQNLPDFDGISADEQSNLISLALPKVLEFYNKQMPDPVDPELIKFIDLRAPSLRPGDVYRAFFHINKQILDSLGDAEIELIATDQQVASSSDRIGNLRQELDDLVEDIESEFCTEGKTLDDEQARIQYEKYRSFASKKKLEISREITQKLLKSRDPSNQVDGLDFDLGVFGRAHLNQAEMQSLLGEGALALLGRSSGVPILGPLRDKLGDLVGESPTGARGLNDSLKIELTYGDLQSYISEVTSALLEFAKDLENYTLNPPGKLNVQREVRFLREFPNGLQNLVNTKGDDSIKLNADSKLNISFTPLGKGSSLKEIGINGKQVYPISGRSQNAYANSLRRSRTAHYIRNIEKMYEELEDGLLAIFKGGSCEEPGPKKGTGASYILKYTADVEKGAKQNEHNFFHDYLSELGDNVVDTLGLDDLAGENWSLKGEGSTFIPSPTFGFENALPSLGDNCTKPENRKAVMKMIKKTFDLKRILCEYIACLGLPGVQAQIPNIPKLKWPKIPALFDSSWEDFLENAKEIGARLACMFLKGILDIIRSPMCQERFIEGIFGAASAQAPEVKRAMAAGFLDIGIPADKQDNAKDLIDALMDMLSPRELCALLNGDQVNDEVYQIVRTIAESLGLGEELQTREQISGFFITIGFFVGPDLCKELSRFDSKIETCDETYSLAAQIRAAAAKGEKIDPAQVQSAIDHAEEQLQNKADALNFLFNGGSLQDLLPDFTSLENNPAFSKPNPRTNRAALEAAKAVLGIAEMSFVSSINGYMDLYFQNEARTAQPGDAEYDYHANMVIQRAVCNLKAFAEFDLDLDDFSSEQTSIRLRRALMILCNDYEKSPAPTDPDENVYTLSPAPEPNTNQPLPTLLQGSLIEKYSLLEMRTEDEANLYSTYLDLQPIYSMMFPIQCGDLDGSTRTISSIKDWPKDIFFGGNLTPGDISTLNVNYLNKVNQVIETLREQITNNIERAFTTRTENTFLSGIGEFYDPQEVQDGKADDLLSVKVGTKLETTLKHPVTSLRKDMQVEISEDFGPGDVTDIARTKIKIVDRFFLKSKEPYEVQYCEKIPPHLVPPNTDVLPRPAAYRKAITNILKSKYQAYKTGNINVNNLFLNIGFDDRVATRSFSDAYEGLYEQIASGVRTSRLFSDPIYRERLDLKLRGKYYFDPKSGCFKNTKSRPSFGVLNFEKLITNHFPDEYLKEFANPLNSPLTEDYLTPGPFEKAMMNITLAGFVRMCLVEALLKGALTISVWDIDFVKSSKIYRDYLVEFVNNQLDSEKFFTDNAQFRDDTIQRIAATSNIEYGRRKIILRELDGVISSLSKDIFENDPGYDFSQWFMDSIPFVQVPNTRAQDGSTWLTNVDFNYFEKLKNNNFVFLEDYVRVNGSIRSFRSSREQIARAQLETLESKMSEIRDIDNTVTIPGSMVTATNISSYNIGDPASVSLEGAYDDTDRYPNTELMSTKEFSELIKSLVDNNSELSRYFHKLSGKTYSPGSRTHGMPDILSRGGMPSRIVKRTRQHVTFDKANIFSLLLKKRSDNALGNGEKAVDKFVDHHYGTCQQDKSSFLFNVLTTGEYGETKYQIYSEAAAAELIRKAFKFGKKSEDRYYAITTNVDAAFAKEEEYKTIETDEDLKSKDVGNDFKTRTGSTYFESPEETVVSPPGTFINDTGTQNLNFKVGNFKSGNNDPALRERTEGKNISRRSSGNTENLFHSPRNKTTKEQYDLLLEENPDLPSEIWEETVIDLVGDSAPIFMFAGDSGWIPKDHMTDEQKKLIGKKLKETHKWIDNGEFGRLDRWTKGIIRKLYECNQDTPEVIDPKRSHFTNVFAWEDSLPTGAETGRGLTQAVRDQKEKAFPIKPFGSAYGTKWSARSAYDKCWGHMTRVYYKNDITFKKNPERGNYDLTYPNEMLTPNEYKIPLRILITQVKNREGQVLKVFVRYVLPQFLDFENEGLNDYRAQNMTDATVDMCDGWFNFIKESFKKVMTGWYASGDGRYDTWKNFLTNPADPLNSNIRWGIGVLDALRQGGDDTAHPFPPWTVGTSRLGDTYGDNSWWGSRQGAWCSSSKLYSHACRIEADKKEGNFQESESFLDSLFDNPGNLLRKPGNSQISADPIEAYNSFRNRLVGSFSGAGKNTDGNTPNPTPDGLPDDHAKNFDLHVKEMFMYYNLSKHNLYDYSLHQTLRTYTGILGEAQAAVPNSGTTTLQTIGNLVSWFSQKRSDSFWGRTSAPLNRWKTVGYGDSDTRANWKAALPSGQHKYERQWELEEATNNRCGPSLFYNDMRAPTTTMMYNALQHFSDADRKRFAINLYPDNQIRLNEPNERAKRQSWDWLLKNCSQIDAYAYFYPASYEKHYDQNMTELPTKLFLDSDNNLVDPGHEGANFYIQHNDHRKNPVKTGQYFYWNLSETDAKKMNMYMHPTEVSPQINGYISEWQAAATIKSALNDELIDYKKHVLARTRQMPNLASSILSRWNAALDEIGLTEIIREVTTGYTSRLEGDETIISDILEESEISYGLRASMFSTEDSGDGQGNYGLNTALGMLWTDNSDMSEEERCGMLKMTTPDNEEMNFFNIPLASHEFPLASIECFQATNLTLLEQKIKEIQPQMKKSLIGTQEYKDFFEFILPYKRMATSLTIHGTTIFAGFGEVPLLLSSTKSGLASAFAASTLVDPHGENIFGKYPSGADVLAALGSTGLTGGEDPDCFDVPDLGEWLKMLMEMIKEFIKYFPSVVFRGISDQIDPMYKEMKRHYLACELPDLRNGSWAAKGGRYSKTPLGLYGNEPGEKSYLPVNINFPVDLYMGFIDYISSNFSDASRLLMSMDRLVGYIFGGPLPLLDGPAAFKIPCAKLGAEMDEWSKYKLGTTGRYGHSITPLNLIALMTLELPRDKDLRRSICQTKEIANPVVCDDEE